MGGNKSKLKSCRADLTSARDQLQLVVSYFEPINISSCLSYGDAVVVVFFPSSPNITVGPETNIVEAFVQLFNSEGKIVGTHPAPGTEIFFFQGILNDLLATYTSLKVADLVDVQSVELVIITEDKMYASQRLNISNSPQCTFE